MKGQLFELFGISFPSYFVLLLTGFILATVIGALWTKRMGHDPDVIVDLGLAMLLAGVVGARLLHVIADGFFWDYVHLCTDPSRVTWEISQSECESRAYNGIWDDAGSVCRPQPPGDLWDKLGYCLSFAQFWNGGLTYYGGFLGASLAAFYLLKADRFPFWKAADMAGVVVPLGLAFGRMGCLLAGCCFGKPWESPLSLSFPPGSPASESQFKAGLLESRFQESLSVHATQVYESALSLGIAAFLMLYLQGRKRFNGQVFLVFVALYAVMRFVVEIVRSDDRGGLFGLSTSQLFGLGLLAAVLFFYPRLRARHAEERLVPSPGES